MQNSKTILLVGASGLVGSFLLKKLLASENDRVVVLVRKPLNIKHKNLEEKIVNFDELDSLNLGCEIDEFYCALGTTIKKAKTKENFYKVDFGYALASAELALRHKAKSVGLISAIGANSKSSIFYSRVKGLVEEAISKQDWKNILFVRPSFILGDRAESRYFENLGKKAFVVLSPIIKALARKYRPVQAEEIAEKTISELRNGKVGKRIFYF